MLIINDLGTLDVTPNKPITNSRRLSDRNSSVDDSTISTNFESTVDEHIQLIEEICVVEQVLETIPDYVYVSPEPEVFYAAPEEKGIVPIETKKLETLKESKVPKVTTNVSVETNNLKGSLGVTSEEEINRTSAKKKYVADIIKQGEEQMADIDTMMVSNELSDIRLEQQKQAYDISRQSGAETNEIVKEGLKATAITDSAVKDARYEISSRIDHVGSRTDLGIAQLADRFFTVARDTADLRAQVIQAIDTTKMATELNALKGIIEGQRNTTYLADKITSDGEKTRDLISDLKYHDLSRGLIERNSELVEERNWGRHWYAGANQAQFGQQFAQLQSQMQNFNSQLAETRQGMVNFGTMAGVGQTSTANNVR